MEEKKEDEYNELFNTEEEIKKELNTKLGIEKGFKKYCLINNNWVDKYKKYLDNPIDDRNLLKFNSIKLNHEDKNFKVLNKNFSFGLPTNFELVTERFINLLSEYFNKKEQNKLKSIAFDIIIGGKCLIMKDYHEKGNNNFKYAFISIFNEEKNEFSHKIDYFININNFQYMKETLNNILKNNIWNYFEKIKYNYQERYKEIIFSNGKARGYIVRSGNLDKINEIYDSNIKHKINDIAVKGKIKMNNIEINQKLNSFLLCLCQVEEFKNNLLIIETFLYSSINLSNDLFSSY